MNSVFVYCEIEEGIIADVSLELLTKGRTLATELGVKLEAIVLGSDLKGVEKQVFPYGVDVLWLGDDKRLAPYTTLPHTSILVNLFKQENLRSLLWELPVSAVTWVPGCLRPCTAV